MEQHLTIPPDEPLQDTRPPQRFLSTAFGEWSTEYMVQNNVRRQLAAQRDYLICGFEVSEDVSVQLSATRSEYVYPEAFDNRVLLQELLSPTSPRATRHWGNLTYTLTARVKSSGGQTYALMDVKNYGGSTIQASIGTLPSLTLVTIANVPVTNNQATIGFYSNSVGGKWLSFDDVRFVKL